MRMLDEVWKQALWRADKSVAAGADAGKLLARFALFLSDSKEATGQPADTRLSKPGWRPWHAWAPRATSRNVVPVKIKCSCHAGLCTGCT